MFTPVWKHYLLYNFPFPFLFWMNGEFDPVSIPTASFTLIHIQKWFKMHFRSCISQYPAHELTASPQRWVCKSRPPWVCFNRIVHHSLSLMFSLYSLEHKGRYFKKFLNCFCPFNKSQRGPTLSSSKKDIKVAWNESIQLQVLWYILGILAGKLVIVVFTLYTARKNVQKWYL